MSPFAPLGRVAAGLACLNAGWAGIVNIGALARAEPLASLPTPELLLAAGAAALLALGSVVTLSAGKPPHPFQSRTAGRPGPQLNP